jgi:hypothetical protein
MEIKNVSMKILVCGDRNWKNIKIILKVLLKEKKSSKTKITVVHGAAKGADTIAGQVALKLKMNVKLYPAQWQLYGRAAGFIRNRQMLDENPDISKVIAFHNNISESKGTKDMLKISKKRGITTKLYTEEDI